MPNLMTYSQACARFYNLATTGISIGDAIVEAIDRIYEMGRFPGTTVELTLSEADFEFDEDVNAYFLFLDDDIYDGAIGFRSDGRGWSIVDQAILYKDGINAGDLEFVDYSTVDYFDGTLTISGTFTDGTDPVIIPVLYPLAGFDGTLGTFAFSSDGETAAPLNGPWYGIMADVDGKGRLIYVFYGFTQSSWSMVAPPDLADPLGWTLTPDSPATGIPVLSMTSLKKRKYRAPLGFCPDQGPYYALMKLDAPELEDDTVIQVPVGPLKCAVLAVCQEYVGDDDRALLNWQKFDNFMTRSERQTHGPKRWFMGFDSSLRRKPTQFM